MQKWQGKLFHNISTDKEVTPKEDITSNSALKPAAMQFRDVCGDLGMDHWGCLTRRFAQPTISAHRVWK